VLRNASTTLYYERQVSEQSASVMRFRIKATNMTSCVTSRSAAATVLVL